MTLDPARVPYVQSVGSLDVPPPYHFPGVTVNAFVWRAPMAPIRKYCDTFLNLGTAQERGFTYKPAPMWPYATLLFLDYPVMISSNPAPQDIGEVAYGDRGIISQTEVFVAIPVIRYGVGGTELITRTELEWILPFIAVGNPMSAVCGREMLGLGKLLADITTEPGIYPDSFHGEIKIPGWRSVNPGSWQENLTFIDVKTGPTLPTFRTSGPTRTLATLMQSREASWLMDGLASLSNLVDTASLGMFPTSMRTIGLKQYRDAQQLDQAIYQALVACRANYTNIRAFRFYDERDVAITVHAEGSFAAIVDLIVGEGARELGDVITTGPAAAYSFMADIDYDSMAVTHEFVCGGDGTVPTGNLDARWFQPLRGFFSTEPRA